MTSIFPDYNKTVKEWISEQKGGSCPPFIEDCSNLGECLRAGFDRNQCVEIFGDYRKNYLDELDQLVEEQLVEEGHFFEGNNYDDEGFVEDPLNRYAYKVEGNLFKKINKKLKKKWGENQRPSQRRKKEDYRKSGETKEEHIERLEHQTRVKKIATIKAALTQEMKRTLIDEAQYWNMKDYPGLFQFVSKDVLNRYKEIATGEGHWRKLEGNQAEEFIENIPGWVVNAIEIYGNEIMDGMDIIGIEEARRERRIHVPRPVQLPVEQPEEKKRDDNREWDPVVRPRRTPTVIPKKPTKKEAALREALEEEEKITDEERREKDEHEAEKKLTKEEKREANIWARRKVGISPEYDNLLFDDPYVEPAPFDPNKRRLGKIISWANQANHENYYKQRLVHMYKQKIREERKAKEAEERRIREELEAQKAELEEKERRRKEELEKQIKRGKKKKGGARKKRTTKKKSRMISVRKKKAKTSKKRSTKRKPRIISIRKKKTKNKDGRLGKYKHKDHTHKTKKALNACSK